MKLPRLKECKVCGRNKIKAEHFRITDKSRKYTSTVCIECEKLLGIKVSKKAKKAVKKKTQRCCIECNKVKGLKAFRIVFAPTRAISRTCRKCEESLGLYREDDTRSPEGFMYILFDSSFPELIKIGCTTDPEIRLFYYNKDKPTDTCSFVYMSKLFLNVFITEKDILRKVQVYAQPEKGKKEWFPVRHRNKLIEEIKLVEADI